MRRDDILELLNEVEEILVFLGGQIKLASSESTILELSKPKVKSALEHLRSCLEYAAHDIYDFVYSNIDGKTEHQRGQMKLYFPYGKTIGDFHSSLGRSFKELITVNQEIYDLIKSIQPFSSQQNWLYELCDLTNKIKHVEQKRQDRRQLKKVSLGNLVQLNHDPNSDSSIIISGNNINGIEQGSDFAVKGRKMISNNTTVKVSDFTEFTFKDTKISVYYLLKTSHDNISNFVNQLYTMLEKI